MSGVEDLLKRAYERLGPRYLTLFVWGALPYSMFATAAGIGALTAFFDGSIRDWVELMAAAMPLEALCVGVTYRLVRTRIGPAVRWLQGDRSEDTAVELWRTLNTGLFRAVRLGVLVFSVLFIPYAFYATSLLRQPVYATVGTYAGALILILWAATLIHFWYEAAARPVLMDVMRFLPVDMEPTSAGLNARQKIMISSTIFAIANIMVVSAVAATLDSDPASGISIVIGLAVLASVSVAFLGNALIARSVVGPVAELISASRAVGQGDLTTNVPPLAGDEFGMLTHSFNQMVRGLAEREALRSALGSYVEPQVAERLLAEGELLDGAYVDVTVLFLDLRGFTTQAEFQDAADTVTFLNGLFGRVVPLVASHGGHVNKFTGDGLLAVFGTPEQHDDHADRAVMAASAIAATMAEDAGSRFGIGINSGRVVAGTIGGGGHLEFAVIGDAVNVASRVEALTKDTNDVVLLTGDTKSRLSDSETVVEPRGTLTLRGRTEPTEIFALQLP
jgi:adenylate cyclase